VTYWPGVLPLLLYVSSSVLGYAYVLAGRPSEALPLLEQYVSTEAMQIMRGRVHVWLSVAYLRLGRLDEALAVTVRGLELCRMHARQADQAWTLRLLSEIHAHRQPPEAELVEASYREALALAEALGMRPLQTHCHRSLGTLYATIGQREQARTALSTAINLYRAMEMTFWLPEAEAGLSYHKAPRAQILLQMTTTPAQCVWPVSSDNLCCVNLVVVDFAVLRMIVQSGWLPLVGSPVPMHVYFPPTLAAAQTQAPAAAA
jgi:tetratricopeptide (TPR) repeat protein